MQLPFICTTIHKMEDAVSEPLLFHFPKMVLIYRAFIKFSLNVPMANVFHSSSKFDGISTAAVRLWKSCVASTKSWHNMKWGLQKSSRFQIWWLSEKPHRLWYLYRIIYQKYRPILEEGSNVKGKKMKSKANLYFPFYYPREDTSRPESLSELHLELCP